PWSPLRRLATSCWVPTSSTGIARPVPLPVSGVRGPAHQVAEAFLRRGRELPDRSGVRGGNPMDPWLVLTDRDGKEHRTSPPVPQEVRFFPRIQGQQPLSGVQIMERVQKDLAGLVLLVGGACHPLQQQGGTGVTLRTWTVANANRLCAHFLRDVQLVVVPQGLAVGVERTQTP